MQDLNAFIRIEKSFGNAWKHEQLSSNAGLSCPFEFYDYPKSISIFIQSNNLLILHSLYGNQQRTRS